MKANSGFSISSSTSISVFPSHENTSRHLGSGELLNFLFDDKQLKARISEREEKLEDEVETVQEYSNVDEDAPTLRSEPSVLCINCYENVHLEQIDEHSLICVKPVKNHFQIQEKLKNFLTWLRDFRTESRELYLYPCIVLEDIVKGILEETKVKKTLKRITQASQDFQELPVILLACQKLALLVEALTNESEISVSPVISSFSLNEEELSAVMSSSRSQNSIFPCSEDREIHSETIEKFFYSQFIKLKMDLKISSHPSMFELYEKCLKEHIPIDNWRSFIHTSLINN